MKISEEHWHASAQQRSQAMRRIVIGCTVIVVSIAAFYSDLGDIAATCKGHCWTQATPVASPIAFATPEETPLPPDYTPSPEERCGISDGSVSLLGLAELDSESGRPLCLIEVALSAGASSQSITDPG